MSFCTKCGKEIKDGTKFCPYCGAPIGETGQTREQTYEQPHYDEPGYSGQTGQNPETSGIEHRDIALYIILSIVTCGIYGLYWMYNLNRDTALMAGEEATDGALVIIFTIITCGIYGAYWNYKLGERTDKISGMKSSNHILFLVLALIGFSIVNYAIAQDTINKNIA